MAMKPDKDKKVFQKIFETMSCASCVDEIVYENGKAVDYRILDINCAFAKLLGADKSEIIGKKSVEIYGVNPPLFFDIFLRVAETGIPETFVGYFPIVKKHFKVNVSSPQKGMFSNVLYDVTEEIKEKNSINRERDRLQRVLEILQKKFNSVQEMLDYALSVAIEITGSRIGYIYTYSEDNQLFTLNSWSKEVMPACSVVSPQSVCELEKTGLWGEVVRQRKPIIVNDYSLLSVQNKGLPQGHVNLNKYLSIPVFFEEKIVAVVGVANKTNDYEEIDTVQLQLLMDSIWKKVIEKKATEKLQSLEWMLSGSIRNSSNNMNSIDIEDLTGNNLNGKILHTIGKEILEGLAGDYLDLISSSSAIFEENGDYALGIFSSEWCKFLNASSRKLCNTSDLKEAMTSKKWLCHESCWTNSGQKALKSGQAVDIECAGGIRVFAVPIKLKENIVGAISFGYGNPTKDAAKLKRISEKFNVSIDDLLEKSNQYHSRPAYIIEMAKKRLLTISKLIGTMLEAKETEFQLLHAMKMDAIGRLAGGVAHDFNNMLSVILGHAEMAYLRENTNPEIKADLEQILSAGKRSAELTKQLLGFARKQNVQPRVLDVSHKISNMTTMLKRLIGENIELLVKDTEDKFPLYIDPSQLDQIIVNLVINAAEAISGHGKIIINLEKILIKETHYDFEDFLDAGAYTKLSISDNGCGMSPNTLKRIFEPFFTTKNENKGTGLGLATVYGIVKQNGGTINVYSEEGHGTTFKIYLPIYSGETVPIFDQSEKDELVGGIETILLVEDEESLLSLTKSMLEKLGYKVISSNCPLTAIEIAKKFKSKIDLVLTDVLMPQMNGKELFKELHNILPNTKVLFMSGYAAEVLKEKIDFQNEIYLMEKPFSFNTISQEVRKVLDN